MELSKSGAEKDAASKPIRKSAENLYKNWAERSVADEDIMEEESGSEDDDDFAGKNYFGTSQ